MAKVTWDQIEKRPDYQALDAAGKREIKAQYLAREVEPTPQFKSLSKANQAALKANFLAGKYQQPAKPAAPKKKAPIMAPPTRTTPMQDAGSALKEYFDNNVTGATANKVVRDGMAALPQSAKPLAQQWTERQARQIDTRKMQPPKSMPEQLRDDLNAAGEVARHTVGGMIDNLTTGTEGLGHGLAAWGGAILGSAADPMAMGIAKGAGTLANKAIAKGASPMLAHGVAAAASGGVSGGTTSLAQGDYANVGKSALLGALLEGATSLNGVPAPARTAATAPPARPPIPLRASDVLGQAPGVVRPARRRAAVTVARALRETAPPPARPVSPRAGEKAPPLRPLHPGHRVGPMPAPADTINPAAADFPAVDELIEVLDAQARAQARGGPAPEPGLPVMAELTAPAVTRDYTIKGSTDELPIHKGRMNPGDLRLDANAYQFKASTVDMNNTGVTERLMGDVEWSPKLAARSPITVHQRKDGTVYTVDGHQRTNKAHAALAAGQDVGDVDVMILREADGWTTEKAKNYGAFLNLADGTGTPIDAAKVIRGGGLTPAQQRALPKKGPEAESFIKGREIAKLGNEAFSLAINMFPNDPKKAAMVASLVGQRVKTPEIQAAILREFIKDAPGGAQEVSNTIDQLLADGFDQMSTDQLSMFGKEVLLKSNARDIAKMLVTLGNDIKADKATTARLIRSENRVTAIEGNTVNREATAAALDDAKQMEQALALLGVRDQEFRNTLTAIAKSGASKKDALAQSRAALAAALDRKQQAQQAAPAPIEATVPQAPAMPALLPDVVADAPAAVDAPEVAPDATPAYYDPDAPAPETRGVSSDQGSMLDAFFKLATEESGEFKPQVFLDTVAEQLAKMRKDKTPQGIEARKALARQVSTLLRSDNNRFEPAFLRLIAEESGELDLGVLGTKAATAVTYLREVWRKLVNGESVDTERAGRAVLRVTAAEMPEARAEAIRAKARQRAAIIRAAAAAKQAETETPATVTPEPVAPAAEPVAPVAPAAPAASVEASPRVAEVAPAATPTPAEAPPAPTPDGDPAPRPFLDTRGINPDEFLNVGKLNMSEAGAHRIRQIVAEDVAENGRTKTPIPHQTYVDAAREMGMSPDMLRVPRDGETITPTLHAKLKMELKGIGERITAREAEFNRDFTGMSEEALAAARQELDDLEADAKAIMNVLIPARSQDGRNLAFHRWMAESSFDTTYWVARARRQAGLAPDQSIPDERAFIQAVERGAEAQDRMQATIRTLEEAGIRDHGIDPNDPDLDDFTPERVRLFRDASMREFLEDEQGSFDLIGAAQHVGEWAMGLGGRHTRPGPDAKHRLKTHPSADPEVRRLIAEGLTAAAEVRAARIEMATRLAKVQRTPKLAVLSAARKVGLLVNPGTMTINVLGGLAGVTAEGMSKAPALVADPFVGWVFGEASQNGKVRTGRRTVDMNWKSIGQASRAAATKGIKDAASVWHHGMTRDQLAKLDMPREINSGNPAIDWVLNKGFRTAGAPDKIFFNYAHEASLREQARLYAINERRAGLHGTGWDMQARADEIYDAIRHPAGPNGQAIDAATRTEMVTRATDDALYATFNNETIIGNVLQGIPGLVNMSKNPHIRASKPAVDFLYDQVVTFKAIPGAVATRALDYSLVGLGARALWHLGNGDAKRVWKEGLTSGEQRAISMALGRGATGFALMMTGLALSERGWIEGAYDPETKDVNEAAGRLPSSVRVKFPWMKEARFVPIGQLAPQGAMLVVGAMLREMPKDPAKVGWSAFKTVADSPMMSGIKSAADAWKDEEGIAKFLARWSGSWVPSVVGQTAKALDPSGAEVQIDKERALETGIQAKIPGLRNQMPRKMDMLGQPVEAPTGLAAYWRFHGREAKEDNSPLLQALVALNRELPPGEKVRITKPGHSLTINKVKLAMPPEVAAEYDALSGQLVAQALDQASQVSGFAEASATDRKAYLDEVEADTKKALVAAIKGEGQSTPAIDAFLQKHAAALRDAYQKGTPAGAR